MKTSVLEVLKSILNQFLEDMRLLSGLFKKYYRYKLRLFRIEALIYDSDNV